MKIEELKKDYPLVYKAAVAHYEKQKKKNLDSTSVVNDFLWSKTPEGSLFWCAINCSNFSEAKGRKPKLFLKEGFPKEWVVKGERNQMLPPIEEGHWYYDLMAKHLGIRADSTGFYTTHYYNHKGKCTRIDDGTVHKEVTKEELLAHYGPTGSKKTEEKEYRFKSLEYNKWYVEGSQGFIKVKEFSVTDDKVSGSTVHSNRFLKSDYWCNPNMRRAMELVTNLKRLEWLAAMEEKGSYIDFETFKSKPEIYPADSYILFLKQRGFSGKKGSILRVAEKDSLKDMLIKVTGYGYLDVKEAEEMGQIKNFETKALAEEYWESMQPKKVSTKVVRGGIYTYNSFIFRAETPEIKGGAMHITLFSSFINTVAKRFTEKGGGLNSMAKEDSVQHASAIQKKHLEMCERAGMYIDLGPNRKTEDSSKGWFIKCTDFNQRLCREFQDLQKDFDKDYNIDVDSILLSECPHDNSYYTAYMSNLDQDCYKGYKEISKEELQKIVNDLKGVPTAVDDKAKETVYEWQLSSMASTSAKKNQIKGYPLFEVKKRRKVIK